MVRTSAVQIHFIIRCLPLSLCVKLYEKMEFTSPALDPGLIQLLSWDEIDESFHLDHMLTETTVPSSSGSVEDADDDGEVNMGPTKSVVFAARDYAVKVMQDHDPDMLNELAVGNKLNDLSKKNLTQVFNYVSGYVLSTELPPGIQLEPISVYEANMGYSDYEAHHYVYIFSELVKNPFDMLPDEPKANEDFYFEILVGLFYARRRFNFCHWDLHEKNLMFNVSKSKRSRAYKISDFYVTIEDTVIEPKLIDYGKSVVDETYSDDKWREARYKKLWNKSDIYHLSLIFSHRRNLSDKFRQFLERDVLPKYVGSMYARKLEQDSGANHQNIEALLKLYFGTEQALICTVCREEAGYKDVNGFFCGKACQLRYYK